MQMRRRLFALVALLCFVAACGGDPSGPLPREKSAVDGEADVAFYLDGDRLRVELLSGFDGFDEETFGPDPEIAFYCATGDFSRASAHGTARFGDDGEATVNLSHDVSADIGYCYLTEEGGDVEAVAWFRPEEEIFPGEVVTDDNAENERRARAARDCARFSEQASIEVFGIPNHGQVLEPGVPPTVAVDAYWLGPTLDGRRATVGWGTVEADVNDRNEVVPFPIYTISYSPPEEGCLSAPLPGFKGDDLGFIGGREIQMLSIPASSPLTHTHLTHSDALKGKPSYQTRLANGETATVFPNSPLGFTVLTKTTLVTIGGYGSEEDTRRLLLLLRRVGE
jgi:hypothetical protein